MPDEDDSYEQDQARQAEERKKAEQAAKAKQDREEQQNLAKSQSRINAFRSLASIAQSLAVYYHPQSKKVDFEKQEIAMRISLSKIVEAVARIRNVL